MLWSYLLSWTRSVAESISSISSSWASSASCKVFWRKKRVRCTVHRQEIGCWSRKWIQTKTLFSKKTRTFALCCVQQKIGKGSVSKTLSQPGTHIRVYGRLKAMKSAFTTKIGKTWPTLLVILELLSFGFDGARTLAQIIMLLIQIKNREMTGGFGFSPISLGQLYAMLFAARKA